MLKATKRLTILLAAAALATTPLHAGGFGIFEQGSKAMGMAGAFTAQADDGSAMFHNVGGLGFLRQRQLEVGTTIITSVVADMEGLDPFPGAGVTHEQDAGIFTPPHVYYVKPFGDDWTFGLGLFSPFGLATEWEDRFNWPGRFISVRGELVAFDFNPSFGYRVNDELSVGFGAVARISKVELFRHVPTLNPFTFTVVDIADLELESDFDTGFGWNVGILHKPSDRFSWGFSYRSPIEIDYSGDGVFTQVSTGNAQLDGLVSTQLPFGTQLPLETSIEFPDMASLGFAFGLTERLLVEVDVNWTGWSSFDRVRLDFTTAPQFTTTLEQGYDDAYNYRLGIQIDAGRRQWRFGYVYDESPQPDESVGPLLPDANRNGFTIGVGCNDRLDLALMYLPFEERTTTANEDGFFATYNTEAVLFGATLKFKKGR